MLIPAVGQLSRPAVPDLPGVFRGPALHTARWDPTVSIDGRRVAAGSTPLDVRVNVAHAYDSELQTRLAGSVWTACQSWYRTATGRIVTNWPGPAGEYGRLTARLRRSDYGD